MSVDAINGANAQQPQKRSALPNAIASGISLGAIGGTAGYLLGTKTPDLKKVFSQTPDTFDKAEDREAAKTIQDAIAEYKNTGANEKTALRTANNNLNAQIAATTVEKQDELQKAIDDAKDTLSKKEVKIGDNSYKSTDIAKELKEAHKAVETAKTGDDAAQKAAADKLKNAQENAKAFNKGAKSEMEAVSKAKKALADAKKAKFEEAAKADGAEKTLKAAAEEAKTKFKEVKSSKLTEICNREEFKQAFDKVKSALPKERSAKMAAIVGGIAAAVGLIGGYLMGNSHSDNA